MLTRPFFILEMANNHMGDPAHGEALIRAFAPVVGDFPEFAFGFKLHFNFMSLVGVFVASQMLRWYR